MSWAVWRGALERAGDDEVEAGVKGVENVGKLQGVLLAFLIERTFHVEKWVWAADASAGVAENEQIHMTVTIIAEVRGCG